MEVIYVWLALRAAELIGIAALFGISAFVILYSRNGNWKQNRPARAIMYLARGLAATLGLLVGFSFFPPPDGWRWIVEAIVYTPMAWACWNMYFSLLASVQDKPKFLFNVTMKNRKKKWRSVSMTNNDKVISYIRTGVPALIGGIIAWLVAKIPAIADILTFIDAQFATAGFAGVTAAGILSAAAVAGVITLYYIVVRWLGDRWPQVEAFLLGSSKHPVYFLPKEADTVSDAVEIPEQREAVRTAGHSVIVQETEDLEDTQPMH